MSGVPSETEGSLEPWVAALRAQMRREDVERLRADAEAAVEHLVSGTYFRSAALHVLGIAHILAGNEGLPVATAVRPQAEIDSEPDELLRFRRRQADTLTAAELRLLPLLATHLSFRGIGDLLFISPNTVKTEAISTYRKLGASSRNEAVNRATELGLIEATAATGSDHVDRPPAVTEEQLDQLTLVAVVALVDGGLPARAEAS